MPTVIAFANMKGGVGKTTLCVSLAFQIFAQEHKRVLVVDNDPQFNATTALLPPQKYLDGCIRSHTFRTIYDIYEKPPRIGLKKKPKLNPQDFLIPLWYYKNGDKLTGPVLHLLPSRIEVYETLRNPSQKEYLLDTFLKKHAAGYDYILIDCPPTPSVLTSSAFAASDYVVIPVTPDYYATLGLPQFLGTLRDFKEDLVDSHHVTPLGVVFTNVERNQSAETTRSIHQVNSALANYSKSLTSFQCMMSHYKVYQKCIWQAVPVQRISGPGIRGKSDAAADLKNITIELLDKIEKAKKGTASA